MYPRSFQFIAARCNRPMSWFAAITLGTATVTASADVLTVNPQPGLANFQSVQAAVDAASDGDHIVLDDGVYTSNDPLFVVNLRGKAITLRSANGPDQVVIDGQGVRAGVACINGEGNDTVISGITFMNASSDWNPDLNGDGALVAWEREMGAGVTSYQSEPRIENCTFTGNDIGFRSAQSGSSLFNCTFQANSTGMRLTGGNLNDGVSTDSSLYEGNTLGIYVGYATRLSVAYCTLDANGGDAIHGLGSGAINVSEGWLVVQRCTFTDNFITDLGSGAAINITKGHNLSEISNSDFRMNRTQTYGGAVSLSTDTECTLIQCNFTDNNSEEGGAVSLRYRCVTRFHDCWFESNYASRGGAIYHYYDSNDDYSVASPTFFEWCSFVGNIANDRGGAIQGRNDRPQFLLCEFRNNSALNNGGAIDDYFVRSTSVQCTFEQNVAFVQGGAIHQQQSSSSMSRSSFEQNASSLGASVSLYQSDVQFNKSSFREGVASMQGGALYLVENSSASFEGCWTIGNSATEAGGAIAAYNSEVSISGGMLSSNEAGDGGAIFLGKSTLVLNALIQHNVSANDGGVIKATDQSHVHMEWCPILDNRAGQDGGVVVLDDSVFTAEELFFADNEAARYGGAIEVRNGAELQLSNAEFVNEDLEHANAQYGGAIDIDPTAGSVWMNGIIIDGCEASVMGGGIYSDGNDTLIENSKVGGNHAPEGGGVGSFEGNVKIRASTICGNTLDQVSHGFVDLGNNIIKTHCCPSDLNGDNRVDGADLAILLSHWGEGCWDGWCPVDIDQSGWVNGADLTQLLGDWGACE